MRRNIETKFIIFIKQEEINETMKSTNSWATLRVQSNSSSRTACTYKKHKTPILKIKSRTTIIPTIPTIESKREEEQNQINKI